MESMENGTVHRKCEYGAGKEIYGQQESRRRGVTQKRKNFLGPVGQATGERIVFVSFHRESFSL